MSFNWYICILVVYFFCPYNSIIDSSTSVFYFHYLSANSLFCSQIAPRATFYPRFLIIFFHGDGDTKIITILREWSQTHASYSDWVYPHLSGKLLISLCVQPKSLFLPKISFQVFNLVGLL